MLSVAFSQSYGLELTQDTIESLPVYRKESLRSQLSTNNLPKLAGVGGSGGKYARGKVEQKRGVVRR